MIQIHKAALLAAVAIMGFTAHRAYANAFPNVFDQEDPPFAQFEQDKTSAGPNGNQSFIWDYFSGNFGNGYLGSALWIINSQGQFVAAGSQTIPASIGNNLFGMGSSNSAVFVAPSQNTQVVFAEGSGGIINVTEFATWTFNAQGTLIAAAGAFKFSDTLVENITFRDGVLIVKWLFPNGANAVWVLDEFGNIISAAGPFGPFANTVLGTVRYDSTTNTQLWQWIISRAFPKFGLNTWTINSSNTIIAASSFGPF